MSGKVTQWGLASIVCSCTNFPQNVPVKNILKSANIWRRCGPKFVAYFLDHLYTVDAAQWSAIVDSCAQSTRDLLYPPNRLAAKTSLLFPCHLRHLISLCVFHFSRELTLFWSLYAAHYRTSASSNSHCH